MALIVEDRIKEASTTTGTGAFTLSGAGTGMRAFSSVMTSPSDTCYYTIQGVDGSGNPTAEWETGLGTYSAANTLTRTTVHRSSNANALVSFSTNTQVFIDVTQAYLALLAKLSGAVFTGQVTVFPGSGNALVVKDAATTQGSVQFGSATTTYTMRGGADYSGIEYNVPTSMEYTYRINGSAVFGIGASAVTVYGKTLSILANDLTLDNAQNIAIKDSGGTLRNVLKMTSGNQVQVMANGSGGTVSLQVASTEVIGAAAGAASVTGTLSVSSTINKVTITQPASSATLTVDNGKTLRTMCTITLNGNDGNTYLFPGSSDTLAGLANVQIFSKAQIGSISDLTDASTVAVDLSLNNHFRLPIAGNRTLGLPSNIVQGQKGDIIIRQDTTGSRTLAYNWIYEWFGTAGTLSTPGCTRDMLSYSVDFYKSGNPTMTIATPCVVTLTAHGMLSGQRCQFVNAGDTLPTGLSFATTYFAHVIDANTFHLSTSLANVAAGTYIATTGSQSGTHSIVAGSITLYLNKAAA